MLKMIKMKKKTVVKTERHSKRALKRKWNAHNQTR